MEILFNTDNELDATEELEARARELVMQSLGRFEDRLTRVELHLADENSAQKGGPLDIRCSMEARPRGTRPVAVTHNGADTTEALRGAAHKLARALETEFGKRDAKR